MKTPTLLILSALVLFSAARPARAEEPIAPNLTPELQAMLAGLMKAAAQAAPEAAPMPEPAPAAAVAGQAPAARPVRPALGSASSLRTSGLTSGSLQGGRLAPSASVNGQGTSAGLPRLADEDWRQLFALVKERR